MNDAPNRLGGWLLVYLVISLLSWLLVLAGLVVGEADFYASFRSGVPHGLIHALMAVDFILSIACIYLIIVKKRIARQFNIAALALSIVFAFLLYGFNEILFSIGFYGLWILYFATSGRVARTLVR